LVLGLEAARKLKIKNLEVYGDAELIIEQIDFQYDAGASLHAASHPATSARMHSYAKREAQPHFKFEINVIKCLRLLSHKIHAFVRAVDKIGI
jgi:ribonuclease HI